MLVVSNWNIWDPDQAQCFVRSDLSLNFLQRLSADEKSLS